MNQTFETFIFLQYLNVLSLTEMRRELTNRADIQSESSLLKAQQYVINAEADVLQSILHTNVPTACSIGTSIGICSKHSESSCDLARVRHIWLCYDGAADRCTVLDRSCHCGLGLGERSVLSAQRDPRVDCGQWKFDAGDQTREMGRLVHTLQWQMRRTFSLLSGKPL